MAKSMTAYGRASATLENRKITFELRSVNSRYFDPQIRVGRAYSALEDKIKAKVQSVITRGKLDISLVIDTIASDERQMSIDRTFADGYIALLRELATTYELKDDISVMRVAQNKDIFTYVTPDIDLDSIWEEVCPVIDEALEAFCAMRQAEGERLREDLMQKKAHIIELIGIIETQSRNNIDSYREKFESRIRKLIGESGVEIDEGRILTECAIYADRVAIDEEIVRLSSHFKTFDEIFESDEPIGRKLDFLVQEMNRETNTIGSKCTDASIAKIVVEVKSEIEKIREQIQNIE